MDCLLTLWADCTVMCLHAAQVTELWGNAALLAQIGQAAAYKARSWTESANAATLLSLINKTTNIDS